MNEDIRLAKGEDLDALTETVNTHIGSDEIHVTAEDKENWNGKADLSMLETEGYLKKKMVGALPSMTAEFGFSDGFSKFNPSNRCTASVEEDEEGNSYQKITTASNAANMYAFAYLDFSKYTAGAREFVIEFDTKINGDRWYIGLSDLTRRPGESNRGTYDRSGVVFSQGTKDGKYYYINNDLTWKDSFFNGWVHSRIEVNCVLKTVDQNEYNEKFDKLMEIYQAAEDEYTQIKREKTELMDRCKHCKAFIKTLDSSSVLQEFDEGLFCGTVEKITVYENRLEFEFKDGTIFPYSLTNK